LLYIYIYIYRPLKAEVINHYADGLLINLYTSLMPHSFYMTKPLTFFLSLILITSGGRFDL